MSDAFTFSRRSALRGLGVALAAGVAGYVVARNSSAARGKGLTNAANGYGAAQTQGRRLAALGQIPAGGGLILADAHMVLTRGSNGTVHGFSAVCTHQGCTVSSVRNGVIGCPCHGSRFDAQTGAVLAGPAPRPLPPISVVVRGGDVYTS
jgi:Rieske Fe-S protein